jgi:hypothetical protein
MELGYLVNKSEETYVREKYKMYEPPRHHAAAAAHQGKPQEYGTTKTQCR